ncbi:MAG TPA: GNAT family protein [Ilumatobacter sp.]
MPGLDLGDERVRLRTTVASDREALVAIRSTPEVRRRWGGDDLDAEFIRGLAEEGVERLTIEDETGRIIGLIQFTEADDPKYRHAGIDLYVDPAVHRRGYGLAAVGALVRYLTDGRGHHRLVIDPAVDNEAAIACYTKAGFRPVGVMRRYELRADGSWADGLLMELLAGEGERTSPAPPGAIPGSAADRAADQDRPQG